MFTGFIGSTDTEKQFIYLHQLNNLKFSIFCYINYYLALMTTILAQHLAHIIIKIL